MLYVRVQLMYSESCDPIMTRHENLESFDDLHTLLAQLRDYRNPYFYCAVTKITGKCERTGRAHWSRCEGMSDNLDDPLVLYP